MKSSANSAKNTSHLWWHTDVYIRRFLRAD